MFSLTLFYCLLDLSCGECNVYPCILCVVLLIDLFVLCVVCLTVFVDCLLKQFAIYLGVVVVLFLNVMEVFSGGGGALLDRLLMIFQRM